MVVPLDGAAQGTGLGDTLKVCVCWRSSLFD
jgi:hypothetical protein